MNREFWRDKKVLVTGSTGFKGSWLSLWLQHLGSEVIGYALPPEACPNVFEVSDVAKGMHSIQGDVRDFECLKKTIEIYEPEIIIHMAAKALVHYSYINPLETYSTNIMGTVNVLEAARMTKSVRVVIIVTSDKCYRNNEWLWGYRENEPMGGHDPYSSSKGCAELVTSAYRNSYFNKKEFERYGTGIASVRAGNVIGGGDWSEDRLIPDIMKAFMKGRPVIIRSPDAIRPWQHVLEPLHGYLCLSEKLWENGPEFSSAWNFGPKDDDAKKVSWVIDKIAALWGDGAQWDLDTNHHPYEARYLKLDSSKSRGLLGWSPKLDLGASLERVVEWYRKYSDNADMRHYTESEISLYEELGKAEAKPVQV